MMNNLKTKQHIVTVLLLVLAGILFVPLLIGAWHTYPSADDFIMEASTKLRTEYDGALKASLRGAWDYYKGWQGAFVSDFIQFTLLPFTRFGLTGFRLIMLVMSVLFVGSVYVMCSGIAAWTSKEKQGIFNQTNVGLLLWVSLLFAMLGLPNTWYAKEIFFWYTAVMGYLIGIEFSFFSLGFTFRGWASGKKIYFLLAAAFGFASAGVSLPIVANGCSWNLLLLVTVALSLGFSKEQWNVWKFLPFIGTFVGALFNALSPGNFARSRATMGELESYSITTAIKDSFQVWKGELKYCLNNPLFICLLVFLFVLCCFGGVKVVARGKAITWKGIVLLAFGCMVSQYLCVFPIVYGYHNNITAYRTTYMQRMGIHVTVLFWVLYLAQYAGELWEKVQEEKRGRTKLSMLVAAAVVCVTSFFVLEYDVAGLSSGFSFELVREIETGTLQKVFAMRKEVLDTMAAATPGTDVVILMPTLPETKVTYSQGLCADVDLLDNKSAAVLFDLNSVYVEYGVK